MKKLSIGLLAAALSLPVVFAATQSTPSSTPAQNSTSKTAKKHSKATLRKKHNSKKATSAQGSSANPQSTAKTPTGK